MKFGQLIEHYMRNIFLEKSYTNCVGETRPRPFLKKIKIEHISGLPVGSCTVFVLFVKVEDYQNLLKLRC